MLTIKDLNPLADFLTCLKTIFHEMKWLVMMDIFLQCGDHSQTGFWDNKQYLLDPVCIFIVFVNSVLRPFLKCFRYFCPGQWENCRDCLVSFFFFCCCLFFCLFVSYFPDYGTLDYRNISEWFNICLKPNIIRHEPICSFVYRQNGEIIALF